MAALDSSKNSTLQALLIMGVLQGFIAPSFATIYNVPASNVSVLKSDVKAAKPGDTIILDGGTYNTGITTATNGTPTAPITVEGINGATLYGSDPTTGEGIEVNNNYWIFQNLTLNGFHESFRTFAASYGIANNITTNNAGIESFKFKNNSTHWLVENCTVNNSGMEGYYCGDAEQNWTNSPAPDATSFITFYHDINNVNVNDGFDCKEGTSNIRIIDCMSDWQNTVPGAADEGDSGVYNRGDNIQTIDYTVKNNGSTGDGERCSTATVNGVIYGSNASIYGLVCQNTQGWVLYNHQPSTTIYSNYAMQNVAGGFFESGNIPAEPNPSTFTENTWSSAGSAFNEGEFLPINMAWNNSQAVVGDGTTWDFNQQNFADPGVNGNIPVIFFQNVGVTFNDSNNGHYTVNLTAIVSPTSVTVSNSSGNYIFTGSGAIAGAASLTKTGSGILTLNTINTFTGPTNVQTGKLILGAAGALPATTSLSIAAGASVQMAAGIGSDTIASLSITPGGALDITDNTLKINYTGASPAPTIRSYLTTAYQSGRWSGTGIISTTAAVNAQGSTSIGYLDTGSQIEIKYTWTGDANLDGIVNSADLSAMSLTGTTWATGDFNYDGKVNADDDALFMLGSAASVGANISTTLPEPGICISALAFFAAGRRKR